MKNRALVAIAVGVAFAPTPVALADNNWIAMAISDSTGHINIADGASSQGAAEKAVMETPARTSATVVCWPAGRVGAWPSS